MSKAFKQRKPAKATQTVWVERWTPPKPLVGLQAIEKVLNRHTFLVCPESRLVVAVLARAIHDSLSLTNRRMRREAPPKKSSGVSRVEKFRDHLFPGHLEAAVPDFVRDQLADPLDRLPLLGLGILPEAPDLDPPSGVGDVLVVAPQGVEATIEVMDEIVVVVGQAARLAHMPVLRLAGDHHGKTLSSRG